MAFIDRADIKQFIGLPTAEGKTKKKLKNLKNNKQPKPKPKR